MFDSIGAFTKQFTPHEEGYLLYPSRKSGGKLVTAEEFDSLAADWGRIAGRSGLWKIAGMTILVLALWTLLSESLSLPEWSDTVIIVGSVIAMSGWLLWASYAPRRLVKDRAAITPPRPVSDARREARSALNWPFVIFALLFSGAAFFGAVTAVERTLTTWAWLVGSGVFFGAYSWLGFSKMMDGRR